MESWQAKKKQISPKRYRHICKKSLRTIRKEEARKRNKVKVEYKRINVNGKDLKENKSTKNWLEQKKVVNVKSKEESTDGLWKSGTSEQC